MPNPYKLISVTSPEYFERGGRGALARRLLQDIQGNSRPNHISIVGEPRFGKTSLLRYLWEAASSTPNLLIIYLDMKGLQNPDRFYGKLTRALTRAGARSRNDPRLDYLEFEDFLYNLNCANQRMVLLIDHFDRVAEYDQLDGNFFDNLDNLADNLDFTLTLVVASNMPLIEILAAKEVSFSTGFDKERLGLLSQQEAYALVSCPPGGQTGFLDQWAEIIKLAGCHPYFLQLACSEAWKLRGVAGDTLDMSQVRANFTKKAREHYQSIWKRISDEQNTLCAVANERSTAGNALESLMERGYIVNNEGSLQISGQGMADFVQAECATITQTPAGARMQVNEDAQKCRLALVVGVNTYQYQEKGDYTLAQLHYAEQDAVKITELLADLKFDVKMLLGADATCKAIEQAFTEFSHATKEDPHPESCIVFHFSGHGLMTPYNDETAYLVLHDTDPSDPAKSGIEMSKLVNKLLPRVYVPNSLTLLDSCHAGFAAGLKHGRPFNKRFKNNVQKRWEGLRGRMVLAACAGRALAREKREFEHGIFTHYVLKHWRDLDGSDPCDGITFTSLMNYVGKQIGQNHPDLPLSTWSATGAGPAFVLRHLT